MNTPVLSDFARYYDLLYRDKDHIPESAFVHELLAQHGIRSGTILELGCGTGGDLNSDGRFLLLVWSRRALAATKRAVLVRHDYGNQGWLM